MSYVHCMARLKQAAPNITDDEIIAIYSRINRIATEMRSGRSTQKNYQPGAQGAAVDNVVMQAAREAAAQLIAEAEQVKRSAALQVTKLSARLRDLGEIQAAGVKPLDAVEKTIVRDFSGRVNVESMEQRVTGAKAFYESKLIPAWDALGKDWAGFFQNRDKLITLVRELRGEDTGDAIAKRGAKAFHDTAEAARVDFNAAGGNVGRLDDWGMPQHHSQQRVAAAGEAKWVDSILPMLDRGRYLDDAGVPFTDQAMREFLGKAWWTISTDGLSNLDPGKFKGAGKIGNRHAEARQIHFKDAESVIAYWEGFGEKTVVEILHGHIDTMARDVAMVEHFGPNPRLTYNTLRDTALRAASIADPTKTESLKGRAVKLDNLFTYVTGNVKPTANRVFSDTMDVVANLNVAAKLGGASIASFFGDKPMMEAVAHLNNLPAMQRWQTELSLLNPTNTADRRLLQQQGLMLEGIRSGLNRFYEGLGSTGTTGKIANAVMKISGMNAINEIRKGAFGASMFSAIGEQVKAGVDFAKLADSDVRLLRNWGITETDWGTWKLAKLDSGGPWGGAALTPEGVAQIPTAALQKAFPTKFGGALGVTAAEAETIAAGLRREATLKLLGAVNTETEFAVVTPGWRERAAFYDDIQRGTVKGELVRSFLQFKSFPWAMVQRGMDAVSNAEGPAGKAAMVGFIIASTTAAGAMLMQTRETLAGKDPREMMGKDWAKFWGSAFLSGGALGIYGDFLYSANQSRYGSGPLEALAGPTVGPLLELGLVQPTNAIRKRMEGKETHLGAQTFADLKGFIPGNNLWYTKAVTEHLVMQNIMEALSPGYLSSMKQRTSKEFGQDWWWRPGETSPDRLPNLGAMAR